MLYTVSAVQVLATLDAFEELEKKVAGGKKRIGQCEPVMKTGNNAISDG